MRRAIDDVFLLDLREGKLEVLLDKVRKDDTLCLEFRGNQAAIYYRGCRLYEISYQTKEEREYIIKFNMDYCNNKEYMNEHMKEKHIIKKVGDENELIKYLPYYKQAIDYHFGTAKKTLEREFQQLILRENNNVSKEISNATDYFILDMEYTFKGESKTNARADMLALKWESTSLERRMSQKLQLAFVEVKYGDTALDSRDSGISGHIKDFVNFTEAREHERDNFNRICDDMMVVFRQKCELGLITGCKNYDITISNEKPELIFIFANHDPDKSKLKKILQMEIAKYPENILNRILVAKSSEMGYGLFNSGKRRFPNIKEYLDLYSK